VKLGSRWSTKCGTYSLVIKSSPWKSIERECLRASNTETGGIIVGYYTDD
jgi:hypothetical protein